MLRTLTLFTLAACLVNALGPDRLDGDVEFNFGKLPVLPDPPSLPQERFSRPLSPKAQQIYKNVLAVVHAYPDNSPTPFNAIGASSTYKGHTQGYGNTDLFAKSFYDLLVTAQEEVLITSLSWAKNTKLADGIVAGLRELDRRAKAANRRVRVYIAINPFGALVFNKQIPPLRTLFGGKVVVKPQKYGLPYNWEVYGLDLQMRTIHQGVIGGIHNKQVMIDGKIAYVGCKNIDDDPPEEWMLNLEGNVVTSLRAEFETLWQDPLPKLTQPNAEMGLVPTILLGKRFDVGPFQNREYNPMAVGMLTAFELAEKEIYMQTLNLCTRHVVEALLDAVRRGVHVHIVTSFYSADALMNVLPNCIGDNRKVSRYMYDQLKGDDAAMKRLKICWWIGPRNKDPKPMPRKDDWSHIKALAIDGEMIIVGSANQDTFSWYHQWEFNVLFDDKPLTQQLLHSLQSVQRNQGDACYSL